MWGSVINAGFGFLKASQDAKVTRAWEKYNNRMAGIQAGQSNNAVTENVAKNREQHAENKVVQQIVRMKATAQVKAGAAAAGVAGGSVDATLFDVGRNAGHKSSQELDRFEQSLLVTDQQRKNISMQRSMAMKPLTPKPSLLGAMANATADILGDQAAAPSSMGTNLGGASQATPTMWDQLRTTMLDEGEPLWP